MNLVAWAGYVENGSTDPAVDWVTGFEEETGCKVNVKIGNTSDEMVQLMKTGEYDSVSASGDATLRLIAAGDVVPVNTDLIPNYADVFPALKDKPWNSVNGVPYGVPHGRGANLLMWNTDEVTPAPDSWGVVWDEASPYKGSVTAYDSPIYIADAALYLMKTQPDLGITNPYALDQAQFDAAVELLKTQNGIIGEYWSDYTKQIAAFTQGSSVLGTTWQVIANIAQGEDVPVEVTLPEGGLDGLVRHVDALVEGQEPELRLPLDEPHHLAGGQRGRRRVLRRGAVERQVVCPDGRREPLRHLPRRGRGLLRPGLVLDDADQDVPRRSRRHLHPVLRLGHGLDGDQGLITGSGRPVPIGRPVAVPHPMTTTAPCSRSRRAAVAARGVERAGAALGPVALPPPARPPRRAPHPPGPVAGGGLPRRRWRRCW